MAKDINTYLEENEPVGSLDFIAAAIKIFFDNIGYIFSRVFLLNLILILLAMFTILQLDFQLNYSYLNSANGIYVVIILIILLISIQSSTRIQLSKRFLLRTDFYSTKIIWYSLPQIIIQSSLQILVSNFSTLVFIVFLVMPAIINMIFPITSTYFYHDWIHYFKVRQSSVMRISLQKQIQHFWWKSFIIGLTSRILLVIAASTVFVSIFLAYEFIRVFLGGELFVFIEDRITILRIIGLFSIIFFLFFSSITYLCFIILYDYISLKKDGLYLKKELEKITSDDSCRKEN
ncbi:MAG: hypothetical protein FJ213_03580 [Ignavibacteria bacterium]|nr:hypothetical protein [Ignavibacteria bacterium]